MANHCKAYYIKLSENSYLTFNSAYLLTYKNTVTFEGGKSAYYIENKTGYCVEVGTVEGRYSSIVYNSSDRCAKSN